MRLSPLRMDDRGFDGHQQPAASDRDQICIHVTQMQKLKDHFFNKKIMISKRKKSPRTYPPHLSPSAYASIDVTEAQAKAMLQEGTGAKAINISTFRNSKITTALELSSRRWKKHSPRAASPTHVRLKEEVIRLERAVGTSKNKILQEIDVLLHPSNRQM